MRIISQDGTWDIPYESVVIQRFGNDIFFLNANFMGVEAERIVSDLKLATYSTSEKATEVMGSLRNRYIRYIKNVVTGTYSYFQFPLDSEV